MRKNDWSPRNFPLLDEDLNLGFSRLLLEPPLYDIVKCSISLRIPLWKRQLPFEFFPSAVISWQWVTSPVESWRRPSSRVNAASVEACPPVNSYWAQLPYKTFFKSSCYFFPRKSDFLKTAAEGYPCCSRVDAKGKCFVKCWHLGKPWCWEGKICHWLCSICMSWLGIFWNKLKNLTCCWLKPVCHVVRTRAQGHSKEWPHFRWPCWCPVKEQSLSCSSLRPTRFPRSFQKSKLSLTEGALTLKGWYPENRVFRLLLDTCGIQPLSRSGVELEWSLLWPWNCVCSPLQGINGWIREGPVVFHRSAWVSACSSILYMRSHDLRNELISAWPINSPLYILTLIRDQRSRPSGAPSASSEKCYKGEWQIDPLNIFASGTMAVSLLL